MWFKWIYRACFCLGLGVLAQGLYMPSKALLAQHLIAQAWADTQKSGDIKAPWPWMDAHPIAELALPDEKPHIVLNTDSGQALAFGPALVSQETFIPEEMVAIAAHKNTQFGRLKELKANQDILLTLKTGERQTYRVTGTQIIDTRKEVLRDQGPSTLALITCYPFDAVSFNGPLRYVVFAERVVSDSDTPISA